MLYCVSFADALHGWAVGDGGTILATTDGGATWEPQSSGTTDALFAASPSPTPRTAGRWARRHHPRHHRRRRHLEAAELGHERTYLTAVAFADATHGWAVGDDGTILATTDGGATWTAAELGHDAWPHRRRLRRRQPRLGGGRRPAPSSPPPTAAPPGTRRARQHSE